MKKDEQVLGGEARLRENTTPAQSAARVTDALAKKGALKVRENTRQLKKLVVEYVPIESIRPNSYNPNRQDEETLSLLCKSIEEDGFTQPVVVQRSTGEIVDGEHRWRAARMMKMAQIPVCFVDMTDEQMRIATLRHNRARGSEDAVLAVDVLRDLQQLGAIDWAQDSLQLGDEELNSLLQGQSVAEELGRMEEHSESWIPDRAEPTQANAVKEGTATRFNTDIHDQRKVVSMSSSAAAAAAAREESARSATSEIGRARAMQEHEKPVRFSIRLLGDDAALVRQYLGETNPSDELLRICKQLVSAKKGETEPA